ncbi:hypothetical protein ABWK22_02080 [Gottfriedia acidiceleris]|uniref:hypothetical protein n=1 Tax=Gottfriedia acidiceleris TaxID=371036 RepID=UPI00339A64EC
MWFISFVCAYLLIGLVHGFQHMANIYSVLTEVGKEEKYLREMVAMYELTPQGAKYYTELQELHMLKGDLLAEYRLLEENEDKYQFQTFLFGFILWPYYIFSIGRKRATMKRETGR